jgi:hypothetical protein
MLARIFLLKQGKCCGNGCLMCPYEEKHSRGSQKIRKEVLDDLEIWEKEQLILDKIHPSDR